MKSKSVHVTYGLMFVMIVNIVNILATMFLVVGHRNHPIVDFMFNGLQIFVYWGVSIYLLGKLYDFLSKQEWYKQSFWNRGVGGNR